ncbi:MAG: type II secretion system protein GspM [Alphaproteobacteria bacterium]
MTGLSPAFSRVLALALLGLVGLLVYAAAIDPLRARFQAYEDSIAELSHRLGQYARLAGSRPELEAQKASLAERPPLDGDLLGGATDDLAAADLLALVKDTMERNGGSVGSVLPLTPVEDGTLQRIAVRVEFTADIGALRAMLHALESGRPVLVVDRLEVRAEAVRGLDGLLGEHAPVPLAVTLDVHGYRRPGAS